MILRLLFNLFRFGRAGQRRDEVRRDLKSTYGVERAKADHSSKDYLLQRDLAALEDEDKPKRQK